MSVDRVGAIGANGRAVGLGVHTFSTNGWLVGFGVYALAGFRPNGRLVLHSSAVSTRNNMDDFFAVLEDIDGTNDYSDDLFSMIAPVSEPVNTTITPDDLTVATIKAPSPLPVPQGIVATTTTLTLDTFFSGLQKSNELALQNIKQAMVGVNTRFNRVEDRFDTVDESIVSLNAAANSVGQTVNAVRDDVTEVREQQNALAQQLASLQDELARRSFQSVSPTAIPDSDTLMADHELIILRLYFSGVLCFSKTSSEGNTRIFTGALDEFRSPENIERLTLTAQMFGGALADVSISMNALHLATASDEDCAKYLQPVATTFDDDFAMLDNNSNRGAFPLVPISALESDEMADASVQMCRRNISFLTKNAYGSRHGIQIGEIERVFKEANIQMHASISHEEAYPFWFNSKINSKRPLLNINITAAEVASIVRKALSQARPILTTSTQHSSQCRLALYPGFFKYLWKKKTARPAYVGASQMDVRPSNIEFFDLEEVAIDFATIEEEAETTSVLGKRISPCDDTVASLSPIKRLRSSDEEADDCPIDMIHTAWLHAGARARKNPKAFVADNIVLCIGHPKWESIEKDWRLMLSSTGDDVPTFCASMKRLYYS